jgi:hypothetical protein
MGQNSQTTQQSQNQQTSPWGPVIPSLENLIGQIGGGGSLTPNQQTAYNNLWGAAGGIPNFGAQGSTAVNNLYNSNNGIPQQQQVAQDYTQYAGMLAPYLGANYTNPMTAPGMGAALSTMNQDITNQVNGEAAASGRTGSPDNTQALARGLSQGEGQLLTNEYNTLSGQQLGAMSNLFGAGENAATTEAQLGQMPLQNQLAAIQASGMIPGLYTGPGATQLGVANTGATLPYGTLQQIEQMLLPMGFLGGSAMGSGTSTTTQPVNPWTTGLGGLLGLMALSDRRLKTNITPIGRLNNGIGIYGYNFIGSDEPQVGVMAQEVERVMPEAVGNIGIWKGVDYGAVLQDAANSNDERRMVA